MKKYVTHPLRLIYLGSFFFAVHSALTSYINSSFVSSFIGESKVGMIYGISSFLSLIGLLILPHALNRYGNYKSILFTLSVAIASLAGMAYATDPVIGLLLFICYFALINIIIFSLDVFIEHHSRESTTGRTRGVYLTIVNLGWLISPFLSGVLAEKGFSSVYAYAGFLIIPLIAIIIIGFRRFQDPHYVHPSIRQTLVRVEKNRNVLFILGSNFLLNFFYSWMVIFTPIYLRTIKGYEWSEIGIIFTIMLLPYALFNYQFGKIADHHGEKELLMTGFIVMSAATAYFGLSPLGGLAVPAVILFTTRIGASMVEMMTESYFFKQIKSRDSEIISLYRMMAPLAYIIGPITATIALIFVPMYMLFGLLSIMLLFGIYVAYRLKDTK